MRPCFLLFPPQAPSAGTITIRDTVKEVKVSVDKAFLDSRARYMRLCVNSPSQASC